MGLAKLLADSHANTPTSPRFWVLGDGDGVLRCYPTEEAWKRGDAPKIRIAMAQYVVMRTENPHGLKCIALLPAIALASQDPAHDDKHRSWYLCGWPALLENGGVTDEWFAMLERATSKKPSLTGPKAF